MNPHQRGRRIPGERPSTLDTPADRHLAMINTGDAAPINTGTQGIESTQDLETVGHGMRSVDSELYSCIPIFPPPPPVTSFRTEGSHLLADPVAPAHLISGPPTEPNYTFPVGSAGQGDAMKQGEMKGKGRTARPSRRKQPYEARSPRHSRQLALDPVPVLTGSRTTLAAPSARLSMTTSAPELPLHVNPSPVPVATDPSLLYPGPQLLQPSATFPFPGSSGGGGYEESASTAAALVAGAGSFAPSTFGDTVPEGTSGIATSTQPTWAKQGPQQIPPQPYPLPVLGNISDVTIPHPEIFGEEGSVPMPESVGAMPMYTGYIPPYGGMIDMLNATDITATMETLSHSIQAQYPNLSMYRGGRTTHQVGGIAEVVSRSNRQSQSRREQRGNTDTSQGDGGHGADAGDGATATSQAQGRSHPQVKQWVQFDAEYWHEDEDVEQGSGKRKQGWTWHHA
eukprot:TRINITY_DN1992_c0_g1_i1.p1 TRINITY_DN1992_c0_g1~~TRINITY_DN1992_c0_g1_i1.p1  ORF type:complete len:454 (-),score=21.79 TRINITY_DN1992_c0_g1_i1:265-1626(-)